MFQLELLVSSIIFGPLFIFLLFFSLYYLNHCRESVSSSNGKLPRSYPLIGSSFTVYANRNRRHQWLAEVLCDSPTGTFILHRPLGQRQIFTANPANVQHILKTHFYLYPKGDSSCNIFHDFLGSGIFNVDGDQWKFQRQISSHEFNTKSLRNFVQTVVETELSDRLLPILSAAVTTNSFIDLQNILERFTFDNICKIAFGFDPELSDRLLPILSAAVTTNSFIDLQNILERFTFDNICKIAFGFDPEYLLPSLPPTEFAVAFEYAAMMSTSRFVCLFPAIWKVKRLLDVGSEKFLREAIACVREFSQNIVKKKKQELSEKSSLQSDDLLSRILLYGQMNETLVTDMVISFILAGRDTTSAALTWFFWLVCNNPHAEEEILREIKEAPESPLYDEVKDMVYIQASLYESMRLFPPVPADTKVAATDDILPDGTLVKRGTRVTYHPYAMGRMEKLWGVDWQEFRPERWLEKDDVTGKWSFKAKDTYTYPVFQAGPRICLGKEMAFMQMKRIVAGVLRHFRILPMPENGREPVFDAFLTSKMIGGFPVRFEERGW